MRLKANNHEGFTLIELLVALTLLALLVSAASPMLQMNAKRHKEQELKKSLWQMRDAIDAYKQAVDDGQIKKSLEESGYPSSLQVLVDGVENNLDPKKRKLRFMRNIPRDPFADDENLSAEETWLKQSYDGKEGAMTADVYDVHSRSYQLGINQQPYREW
ncbi:MAG: prepilin-type N-terminal cleavage/methylation domain-containing protein [Methylotenera sp.]